MMDWKSLMNPRQAQSDLKASQLAALCSGSPHLAGLLTSLGLPGLGQGLSLLEGLPSYQGPNDVVNPYRCPPMVGAHQSPQKRDSDIQITNMEKRRKVEDSLQYQDDNDNSSNTAQSPPSTSIDDTPREQKGVAEDHNLRRRATSFSARERNSKVDDREVKKLRRKQSNRESARRSRLRKQRESEALSVSITGLQQENDQLRAENKSLQARVSELTDQLNKNIAKEAAAEKVPIKKTSAFQVVQRRSPALFDQFPNAARISSLENLTAAVHRATQRL